MARQTIEQWIHEVLTDPDKNGPCTAIALVHRVGVKEQELHSTKLGGRQWDAKGLAKMFLSKAENYASELPGVQTFNLLAFYGDRSEWEAIKPFMVNGEADTGGLATEGPTKEGFLQQCMRHTEAMTQMALRNNQAVMQAMQGMMEQVVRENMSLRRENQEATTIVRDAVIRLTESKEDRAMKRAEYERKTAERQQWLSFGPALINAILGREVFPQASADTALVDMIANSLEEDDLQKLAASGVIKPHLLGPLAQRMAQTLEKRRLAQGQAAEALKHVDPELDAMGGALVPHAAE